MYVNVKDSVGLARDLFASANANMFGAFHAEDSAPVQDANQAQPEMEPPARWCIYRRNVCKVYRYRGIVVSTTIVLKHTGSGFSLPWQ